MPSDIRLTQTFTHNTSTHLFTIKWTRLGVETGQPIVFIHGTPWSSFEWCDLSKALSPYYSVYLYDHPGFDQSPAPTRHHGSDEIIDLDGSLRLRAEASAALFRSWGFSSQHRPHVLAHDNGGLVSLRLLLQHDIEFKSLCLMDVVALQASGLPFFKLVAENIHVFNAIPPHLVEGFIRSYVKTAAYKPLSADIEDELCAQWLETGSQGPTRFFQEMVQAHHRDVDDVKELYHTAGSRVPIKILWGAADKWIPAETANELQSILQAQECIVMEDAGHLVQFDQPARLALEIGLWLAKHGDDL